MLPANSLAPLIDDIKKFKTRSGDNDIQDRRKHVKKVTTNELFLNEKLDSKKNSKEESDKKSDGKSNDISNEEFDDKFDDKSDEKPNDKFEQNTRARVRLTTTCSIIYVREKLV